MPWFIVGLALFAAAYSLWGGLSAVAWTDVIQVVLLVIGGIITTNSITVRYPAGWCGRWHETRIHTAGDKFHMILSKDNPQFNLPGIKLFIGGMWIANLYYWGFNQYIIQRALAAKSLREAQKDLHLQHFSNL